MYDKAVFLKNVTIICDTREQENSHILSAFTALGIKFAKQKLVFGDYSFCIGGNDFSLSCVIERKASVDEFYGNLTKDRDRIEKEFAAASKLSNQFILLIEGISDFEELKNYQVPDWQIAQFSRKIQAIGAHCYSAIQSWQCGNRYCFRTLFSKQKCDSSAKILECFYWFWRNFKKLTASRRNPN